MALRLVIDATQWPADFGRAAALVARDSGARFMHLPARFDLAAQADAEQYVHAAGGLGPSGLYFVERILSAPVPAAVSLDAILDAARRASVVLPVHPAFGQDADAVLRAAERAGVDISWENVPAVNDGTGMLQPVPATCTIALIGSECDHRQVYPAALASLEAAAATLGVALRVDFNAPTQLDEARLRTVQGILLPGGSDMGNVSGQIRAAHQGLVHGIPTLGLCLGMQTMTTAFAQHLLANATVNLAEADPGAPIKSFVAMAGADHGSLPAHRTGDATVELEPGTLLAVIMQAPTMQIRCNHRFHLAPALRPVVADGGMLFSATSFAGCVVDAVEWPAHPFFLGLQGHPELTPGRSAAHPVITAFLRASLRLHQTQID